MATRNTKPLVAALLVAFSPLAAQAAAVPDAGAILQQIKPDLQTVPSSTGTGLSIERAGGEKLPPSSPFTVKTIQIKGNVIFDTVTLHSLVADAVEQSKSGSYALCVTAEASLNGIDSLTTVG